MFFYKFKNVDFEDNSALVDFEPDHNVINFSFSRNRLNTFPWCNSTVIIPFLFVRRISSYSLMTLGFIHFFGSFVQLFCFSCVAVRERIYQLLLYFFLVESLRLLQVFRTFQLKTKDNQYTINLKHPLQAKTRLCWEQNTSFSTWLRVVKVLYHEHFCKTVFQIILISKKNLKKVLLNYMQINIMA